MKKRRASRNRTLVCSEEEKEKLVSLFSKKKEKYHIDDITNKIINGDFFEEIVKIPDQIIDLLIMDPPYNLSKNYNGNLFPEKDRHEYSIWFEKVVRLVRPKLTPNATIYVCSDWRTSMIVTPILEKYFLIRNRITWEREKGRGSKNNWKNNIEDIWFCTLSKNYYFNVDAVKLKRQVIAPYRDKNGKPRDWFASDKGKFRITYPSNIWTDITIPFWSMPENTDHPTQKSEKLIAKLILASSKEGDFVFDPFLGSGTTAVVAKKLNRRFSGIELDREYTCLAQKRLLLAEIDKTIQGFSDGVFWDRNTLNIQLRTRKRENKGKNMQSPMFLELLSL